MKRAGTTTSAAAAIAACLVGMIILAPMRATAATTPADSGGSAAIKPVRPANGGSATTTRPASKVIAVIEAGPADVEPPMQKLIARACRLQDDSAVVKARLNADDNEIVAAISKLLASGGPSAQRVIFESWPRYRNRQCAIMITALGDYYRDHPLHESASAAAIEAIPTVVDVAQMRGWQPGTPPHIVLSRMAQRPELMERVIDRMRRSGAGASQIGGILKASGQSAEAIERLHDQAVSPALPIGSRLKAISTIMMIGGDDDRALATLVAIASGADEGVAGAERAPADGAAWRKGSRSEEELQLQVRQTAIAALKDLHQFNRRNSKDNGELERRIIPVFQQIVTTSQQRTLRDRALYGLSELGDPGKSAIVDLYERETDAARMNEIVQRLVYCTAYPRSLLDEARRMPMKDSAASRAAAARIMRLGIPITKPADYCDALLRLTEDASADAELRRQATAALFEIPSIRMTDEGIQHLLASRYPEVAGAAAMKSLSRSGTRLLSPELIRSLLDSPVPEQRQMAMQQVFPPYRRGQIKPDVALPLLNSQYADVRSAAARAIYADDGLRRSVGVDTARRIGAIMGVQMVDSIATAKTPHPAWPTNLPPAPALTTNTTTRAGANAASQPPSDIATWLWRLTWAPAGLLIAACAIVYGFAMLTVPEPRVAITRGQHNDIPI